MNFYEFVDIDRIIGDGYPIIEHCISNMQNYKEMREGSSDNLKFSWGNDKNTFQYPPCYWS